MGIETTATTNQQPSSPTTKPSELLGRRFAVPNDYVPRVRSQIAQERIDSRSRVQYISRSVINFETDWHKRKDMEVKQQLAKRKRRKPS